MQRVRQALMDLVDPSTIPSASVSVWVEGQERLREARGAARLTPHRVATPDTPYDLASVTKPFAGGAVAAALVQAGRLALDAPVAGSS